MDEQRFDQLSRRFATFRTRRQALKAIAGAVVATVAGVKGTAAQACTAPYSPCTGDAQCCAGTVCEYGLCMPGCRIEGTFYSPWSMPPGDICQVCAPEISTTSWSAANEGMSCWSGDPNAGVTTCQDGVCTGQAQRSCPPPTPCHLDGAVDPVTGMCVNPPAPTGTPCGNGPMCYGGFFQPADMCDGNGFCIGGGSQTVNCAPYQCGNGACASSCSGDSDCLNGTVCCGGECVYLATIEHCSGCFDTCAAVDACTPAECFDDGACNQASACTGYDTCGGGDVADECGCTPNCNGKTCGDDGCGGSCGSCPSDENCFDGACRHCRSHSECGTGQLCFRDGCLPDPCYGYICPEGQWCSVRGLDTAVCVCPTGQVMCDGECVPGNCCSDGWCEDGIDCTTNFCDYGGLGCVFIRIGGGAGNGDLCEVGEFLPNGEKCDWFEGADLSGICDSQYCDPETGRCAPNPAGACIKRGLACDADVPCCFGLPCTRGICWDGTMEGTL